MAIYQVELSDIEDKALRYVAKDPQEWISNAVMARVEAAKSEIVGIEVARMLEDPETPQIPADKDLIVAQAQVKSAAERDAEALAMMQAIASGMAARGVDTSGS